MNWDFALGVYIGGAMTASGYGAIAKMCGVNPRSNTALVIGILCWPLDIGMMLVTLLFDPDIRKGILK